MVGLFDPKYQKGKKCNTVIDALQLHIAVARTGFWAAIDLGYQ